MTFKEIEDASFLIKQLLINQDAERASAEKTGKAIYSFLGHKNCGFAKMPGWWANDEYGLWMEKVFFHSDRQTEDAIHITECSGTNAIGPVLKWYDFTKKETIEDPVQNHKYRGACRWNNTESTWLPKSLIEYGSHTGSMIRDNRTLIQRNDALDAAEVIEGSLEDADFYFRDPHKFFWTDDDDQSHHKRKVYVEVSYGDKEVIKELDWNEYHPSYDEDEGAWSIDVSTGPDAIRELIDGGYTVCLDEEIEDWRRAYR